MYYAITDFSSRGILHVFEDRDERDEFARNNGCFVCDSKQGRKLLQAEAIKLSGIAKSDARELTVSELVGTIIECDYYCNIQDNGLINLSRVSVHWDI